MLILPAEINQILEISDSKVINRGKKYYEQSRVKINYVEYKDNSNYNIDTLVEGTSLYTVNVNKSNAKLKYSCNCPYSYEHNIPCKHVIATIFDLYTEEEKYINFKNDEKLFIENNDRLFINRMEDYIIPSKEKKNEIIAYYENLDINNNKMEELKLVPKLEIAGYFNNNLYVSFKVGKKRLYVIKDICEFGSYFINNDLVRYGKELEFYHNIDAFEEDSKKLVEFVYTKTNEYRENSVMYKYYSVDNYYKDKICLSFGALDEFFKLQVGKTIDLATPMSYYPKKIEFVDGNPEFKFKIIEEKNNICIELLTSEEYYIYKGQNYEYVLYKDKFYRCSKEFSKNIIFLLRKFSNEKTYTLNIPIKEATNFCEYIIPNISKYCNIEIKSDFLDKYKAESLVPKIYLDIDDSGKIIADVRFCYLNKEINPFDDEEIITINRNRRQEQKIKEILDKNNFLFDRNKKNIYISNEKDIYEFIKNGINNLVEKFEVLATDKFKNKNIIMPKAMSMGLRINNDLLEIELDDLDFNKDELLDIIKSYRVKKKFHRLKDGRFVDIDSSGIDTLVNIADDMGISQKDIINGKIIVSKYRAMYLDDVIKSSDDINAKKDMYFKEIVRNLSYAKDLDFNIPKAMDNVLREYQKVGYNWLRTLDEYGFGGILADDMGLGKTLQIISILEQERVEGKQTSIVVCPSSLYINWQKEINKFAPKLKVEVIYGNADKREKLIKNIDKYDVVITSYDLLKRDIENYLKYDFKYIIADEAQYIKNNNTKNAKAIKDLKGRTKFALTGTPMENSLSELWSIFDFCMPGYLFSYSKFKDKIESKIIKDNDKDSIEKLKKLVSPFILRRTKKEVLKELPEKIETKMYNVMNEKQEKIYKAYLAQARKEMEHEIEENGLEKSKIKILSLITRLRQICCHPSLFLENYDGESSKLEQCIQLVEDACASNHKILIFSQFTSMFEILKKELNKRKINYYELTGKTKSSTRVDLVDKFNKDDNVKVFLVSLKAGGTGLNLIGADMVIHFDPWWNLSVQNQATDRAYRIGQRNNVQVFSLITENSIEEKVSKLQEKKQKLADNIIKPGETFISKMNKEEILDLFK